MTVSSETCVVATNVSKNFQSAAPSMSGSQSARARHDNASVAALSDVSFTLQRGRIYGLIGERGAGKTTLLRALAGMLPIDGGRITGSGRVAGLFQPGGVLDRRLTGRQSVDAQAAAWGWSKAQVAARIDSIAEFAGLTRFLDTPLARYSRGMLLRLSFSSIVNLKPDFLLIDDGFAVGDLAFQRDIVRRLRELAAEGVTIVTATHDMNYVAEVCDEVILLERGTLRAQGPPDVVVPLFTDTSSRHDVKDFGHRARTRYGEIFSIRLLMADGAPAKLVTTSDDLVLQIGYRISRPHERVRVGCSLRTGDTVVFLSDEVYPVDGEAGEICFDVAIPKTLLSRRDYVMNCSVLALQGTDFALAKVSHAVAFTVFDGRNEQSISKAGALIRPPLRWDALA